MEPHSKSGLEDSQPAFFPSEKEKNIFAATGAFQRVAAYCKVAVNRVHPAFYLFSISDHVFVPWAYHQGTTDCLRGLRRFGTSRILLLDSVIVQTGHAFALQSFGQRDGSLSSASPPRCLERHGRERSSRSSRERSNRSHGRIIKRSWICNSENTARKRRIDGSRKAAPNHRRRPKGGMPRAVLYLFRLKT